MNISSVLRAVYESWVISSINKYVGQLNQLTKKSEHNECDNLAVKTVTRKLHESIHPPQTDHLIHFSFILS